ncbi:LysR family transcriptional regulator [Metabacillus endolithicus]|uniref:LysR family transcriptional regulator n=1 Tax=Metabacillus endolithicus TaxID=1535204 RepID=A0ABW5C380_9BACI|nr:LysR family transcriptional regulator [Metabacillus endolithicus]UPG62499.1 LysR family transcriptional regulator [Metabacillus endolithicus]
MNDKDWKILKTLYKEKNITKTAEQLFLSQPSLSYRLKQLEKEFNITILYRGRRGIEFTEQGEYLVRYANEMDLKLTDLKEKLSNIDKELNGTLRLGVSRSIALYKIPNLLMEFNSIHPKVQFSVNTGLNLDLINSVYKQEFHIGIVRGNHHWSDEKIVVSKETINIISNQELDMTKLPSIPRIDYGTDPALTMIFDNWWTENYSETPKVAMHVENMEIAKKMVSAGLGYTIVPGIVLEDGSEYKYNKELNGQDGEKLQWITWVLFRKEYLELSTVKTFIDFLRGNY